LGTVALMDENTTSGQICDSVSGARALAEPERQTLLADIVNQCRDRVIAFDLDSTLLDNRPRSAHIMREFGETVCHPLLQQAEPEHWQGWSSQTAMVNMGLDQPDAERLQADHYSFWFERFFSSEYCRLDAAIAGATDYVNSLKDGAATIIYLTGRPEAMRAGTISSFGQLGFPPPDNVGCQLWMKPNAGENDDRFKRGAFDALARLGQVLAAFDNEPTHINAYKQTFPEASCVHLLTDHSMREVKLLDNIPSITHF